MALTVILSVIYLLSFGVILWRIQIPKVMIQTGDEIDKMHNEMNVGEDLKHSQLAYLLAHLGSIRMTVWMIEKTLKVGFVGVVGALLFSKFI